MPENVRCYETECHAGLDPASFPEKAVEKDTGSLNQVQGRPPGVTVRSVMLISFIKTMSFRSSMIF